MTLTLSIRKLLLIAATLFSFFSYPFDWIGAEISTRTTRIISKSKMPAHSVYFNDNLSQWFKVSFVHRDTFEHTISDVHQDVRREYTHTYLVSVNERSFMLSHLIHEECEQGWAVFFKSAENNFIPVQVREVRCLKEMESYFPKRTLRYHPVYKVSFVTSEKELPSNSQLVFVHGARECAILLK